MTICVGFLDESKNGILMADSSNGIYKPTNYMVTGI